MLTRTDVKKHVHMPPLCAESEKKLNLRNFYGLMYTLNSHLSHRSNE